MDTTSLIIEGQNARLTMQEAKRRNKAEIRRKYEAKMRAEIDEANVEAEVTFANTLARIFATGLLTVREIQREILRTNSWDTWVYWRDLAGIPPERASAATVRAKREQEQRGWYWAGDTLVFTDPVEISFTEFDIDPDRDIFSLHLPLKAEDRNTIEAHTDLHSFASRVSAILRSAVAEGRLTTGI
jgi:hypothetical protein